MKTLHLTLQKKWFDMILSGYKKEEYREIKDYWCNRFCLKNWQGFEIEIFEHALNYDKINYDTITFTNGYGKDKPQLVIELKESYFKINEANHKAFVEEKNSILTLFDAI